MSQGYSANISRQVARWGPLVSSLVALLALLLPFHFSPYAPAFLQRGPVFAWLRVATGEVKFVFPHVGAVFFWLAGLGLVVSGISGFISGRKFSSERE